MNVVKRVNVRRRNVPQFFACEKSNQCENMSQRRKTWYRMWSCEFECGALVISILLCEIMMLDKRIMEKLLVDR